MKMKTNKIYLFLIALLIGAGIIYFNFYKISYKNMIPSETDTFVYLEKDLDLSDELVEILEDFNNEEYKKIVKNYLFLRENIKRIMLMGMARYNIDYRSIDKQDIVAVLDFGNKYPFVRFKVSKYFKKEKSYYKLNDKYREKLMEKGIFKEENDLYLSIYRGYYILSLNQEAADLYLKELSKKYKNEKFVSAINGQNMYMIDFEKLLRNKFVLGENTLDTMVGTIDFENKSFLIQNTINFKEDKLSDYYNPEKNKVLDKYVKKDDGLYINSESLSDVIFLMTVYLSSIYNRDIKFNGLDWSLLLEKVGTEAYIDIDGKSGVLTLKDPKFFKFMFELLLPKGKEGEYIVAENFNLYLQDNLLFINEILPENFESGIEPDDLMSLVVEMSKLSEIYGGSYTCDAKLKIKVKNAGDKINMNVDFINIFNEEFKENFIKKIEKY